MKLESLSEIGLQVFFIDSLHTPQSKVECNFVFEQESLVSAYFSLKYCINTANDRNLDFLLKEDAFQFRFIVIWILAPGE